MNFEKHYRAAQILCYVLTLGYVPLLGPSPPLMLMLTGTALGFGISGFLAMTAWSNLEGHEKRIAALEKAAAERQAQT